MTPRLIPRRHPRLQTARRGVLAGTCRPSARHLMTVLAAVGDQGESAWEFNVEEHLHVDGTTSIDVTAEGFAELAPAAGLIAVLADRGVSSLLEARTVLHELGAMDQTIRTAREG